MLVFEFFRKELTEKMTKHNLIPSKIVFLLLGDLVDGFEIYPNQGEMSDPLVNDQLDVLVSEIMNTILHFSAFTEEVKIYAVQGNHGRISKRSEVNNWDSVVYITLEKIIDYMSRVDEELNISIKRANKFLLPFEEGKWKYLIGHGHRILSKGMLGSVKNINNMLKQDIGVTEIIVIIFLMGLCSIVSISLRPLVFHLILSLLSLHRVIKAQSKVFGLYLLYQKVIKRKGEHISFNYLFFVLFLSFF